MTPPAALSASTVIPKNSSSSEPVQVTTRRMIATATAHVQAECRACAPVRSVVRLAKIPTLPIGFIMEKSAATKLKSAASVIMMFVRPLVEIDRECERSRHGTHGFSAACLSPCVHEVHHTQTLGGVSRLGEAVMQSQGSTKAAGVSRRFYWWRFVAARLPILVIDANCSNVWIVQEA